jgi:hypothetical protein
MISENIIGKKFLFTVCLVVMAFSTFGIASAAAISVTRDLPDAVSPGQEFNVSVTQSGFLLNAGIVTETLPAGFSYVEGSLRSDTAEYDEATNNLTIYFKGETTITYLVTAGTAEQIENAAFSGIWLAAEDIQLDKLSGEVEGDTSLTLMMAFDTGTPSNPYPSIAGTHNGTITLPFNLSVSKLYTYPCPGTGGHTEYAAISYPNGTVLAEAHWNGYTGDWHNISFYDSFPPSANQTYNSNPLGRGGGGGAAGDDFSGFTLYANETYNYTIITGSYPQIIHEHEFNATGGVITCEEFKDGNGKTYINWIPAIKLFGEEVQSGPGSNCSITWDDDIQITANGAESVYPTLGINGSTIHLAWVDQRDGGENREIYYNRSTDNGTTWQASDTRISNDPLYSIKADFAVNGDMVHLFWRDNRDGNFEEYLIQSTDGGVSWGPETRLTNDSGYSGCPFPVVSGDVINLFWRDNRLGTFKIYHKRSINAGANWSQDTLLTPDGIQAEFPFPAVFGDTIHVVWRDCRDGNAEIYYKRSTDGGVNWTADQRLTNDPGESEHPKIVVQGNNLHVVWRDNRTGTYEVFYKRSIDGGQTWSGDTRLTSNSGQSLWPLLAVSDDLLHLLWCDDRDGSQALYYTYSSDRGANWEVETKLSQCIAPLDLMGAHPMMVADPYIHVVFNDNRTGENEIYYKRGTISCK